MSIGATRIPRRARTVTVRVAGFRELALRVTAAKSRRSLPVRCGSGSPTSISTAAVLCHFRGTCTCTRSRRHTRVLVGVIAIVFDFFATLFLCFSPLSPLAPEEDAQPDQRGNERHWQYYCQGSGATG